MEVQSWAIRWKWSGTELLHVATPSELFADGAFFCFSVVGACQETDVNPGWTTIYDGSLDPNVKQLRTRHTTDAFRSRFATDGKPCEHMTRCTPVDICGLWTSLANLFPFHCVSQFGPGEPDLWNYILLQRARCLRRD